MNGQLKKKRYPAGEPEDFPGIENYDMTADCEPEWDAERDARDSERMRALYPLTPEEQEDQRRLVDEVMATDSDNPKNVGQVR